jgi:Flp pilus assembly protein TadG
MALVMPIFLMLILGIVEFGRAMMVGQMVTNASREGARLAITGEYSQSDVINYVNGFLAGTIDVSADDITVTVNVTSAGGGDDDEGISLSDAQTRDLVTVNISVPFEKVSYVPGEYLNDKILVGSSTMRHE